MGRHRQRHHFLGQAHVHDHDGDDRFHSVHSFDSLHTLCTNSLKIIDSCSGRGPLKTTMDVINAAKKISEAGNKLDKLTRKIAGQCPESSTKEDLLAYLERIALYCHQIQITSKVKADVQNISGELIVSGVSESIHHGH